MCYVISVNYMCTLNADIHTCVASVVARSIGEGVSVGFPDKFLMGKTKYHTFKQQCDQLVLLHFNAYTSIPHAFTDE
jgi:hypothetical protein